MKNIYIIILIVCANIVAQAQCSVGFQYMASPSGNVNYSANSNVTDSLAYPINYTWSFGDGSSGTGVNPAHIYINTNLSYQTCVTILTANGCTSTFCDSVVFSVPCMAIYSYTLDSMNMLNNTYNFTSNSVPDNAATIVSYSWDFGDSTVISVLQNPSHTYTSSGNYWVCLNIVTSSGCVNSSCGYVNVNSVTQCSAGFYHYLDTITVPPVTPYVFVDQSIAGNSSVITNWNWTFSGGTPATSNLQNPSVVFAGQGYHLICLSISTSAGCVSTLCDSIFIANIPCQITAGFNTQSPTTIGGYDGFIETSVMGGTPPFVYSWNTGQTTANIYNLTSGSYLLNLIDANNCNFTYTTQLYEPYDTTGGPIVDTLTTGIIDTCLGFVPDNFYISNIVTDSLNNTVMITWIFTGGGSTASITVQYSYYNSGNNAVILTLNCGTKTLVTYMSYINITSSVGISDSYSDMFEILVYPVPFNDRLNIVFNSKKSGNINLNMIDVTGRSLMMKQTSVSIGNNTIELNTSDFHSGIYILNIESDGKVFHKQLIK